MPDIPFAHDCAAAASVLSQASLPDRRSLTAWTMSVLLDAWAAVTPPKASIRTAAALVKVVSVRFRIRLLGSAGSPAEGITASDASHARQVLDRETPPPLGSEGQAAFP
ncbi:hypothetical protein [Frigoribacterium sp. SL97]|uniref:hypothetical protein n=1 Tax=Frigoribacterium sp. SL97 TaxID=2994664 RepID=UPI0022707F38|nr:hypothetical protein [Frigoribacterium sp. SL97]WAC50371.1 hypothetical protein OVA02_10750 [Frigoribacterium sp. SL97]